MRQYTIKEELTSIDYHRKTYDKFVVQAILIIGKLHETLKSPAINLTTEEVIDNSFKFAFWGNHYIVKAEILFNPDQKAFISGELNTYKQNEDNDDLIFTYSFDYLGNIGNRLSLQDFSLCYFVDSFNELIRHSINNNVKFQLK